MVDSIGNNGGLPPVQSGNRTQGRNAEAARSGASGGPVDEVSISSEAAQLLANDTRRLIEERTDTALSNGRNLTSLL